MNSTSIRLGYTNRHTGSRYVSSKNGLFEFYVKIVAEAIRFIENDLFELFGKNVQRKKFFRIEIAIRFIENGLFEF